VDTCGKLAPETAALAFFDTNLTIETNIKMVDSIKLNNLTSEINKRIIILQNEVTQIMKKEMYDFIYVESTSFFHDLEYQHHSWSNIHQCGMKM